MLAVSQLWGKAPSRAAMAMMASPRLGFMTAPRDLGLGLEAPDCPGCWISRNAAGFLVLQHHGFARSLSPLWTRLPSFSCVSIRSEVLCTVAFSSGSLSWCVGIHRSLIDGLP
jgi:hypothetical protein